MQKTLRHTQWTATWRQRPRLEWLQTCQSPQSLEPISPSSAPSLSLWVCANNIDIDIHILGFPRGSVVKNLPANVGDSGWIPGSGRPPGGGNGHTL